jgi:ribosomal protein S18 acetylase RimI-like enzyme
LAAIAQRCKDWDLVEIPQLRPGSPLLRVPVPPAWKREVVAGQPSPLLALCSPLPKAMAANLRTAGNRARRAGAVSYQLADADTLPVFLEALARLHGQRWAERGQAGVLADAAVLAAHAEAAPLLQAAGMLRLHGLRVAGELVAVLYCLLHARRCCYYLGGFDPRWAAISPGTLLVGHAIEQARAEGATAFDFLRGAEPYKYRWGAVDQAMVTLRLARDALTGDSFSIALEVVIRACREEDLPALEWFGLFAAHRPLIRRVWQQHLRGEALMLVAQVNGETSGQLWIAFDDRDGETVAEIWAVRVLPCLQRRGVGARMIAVAEALLRERGLRRVELAVETDNPDARRLYERLGYVLLGTTLASDPPGARNRPARPQWVLGKALGGDDLQEPR